MNQKIDRVFDGLPPSFQIADEVLYITRGRQPSVQYPPLTLEQWLNHVNCDKNLSADEFYRHSNIDRGCEELWRERGRARWNISFDGKPEWLHFSQASIDYIHDHTYKSGKHIDRYQLIRKVLGENPTLESWRDYVDNDPWLELDEYTGRREAGRALWLNRKGEIKHIFRYMPSSVWMPIGPFSHNTYPMVQVKKLELCKPLAVSLSCEVWHGRNEVIRYSC